MAIVVDEGSEQTYMQTLSGLAAGIVKPPDMQLPFPPIGFGGGTPNHKALRVAVWLLEAAKSVKPVNGKPLDIPNDPRTQKAAQRCQEFYTEMARAGHYSIGGAVEVLTASHAQLWYAACAGHLWGARLAANATLVGAIESEWRTETGACRKCTYTDAKGLRVLTPGARAGSAAQPKIVNSCRDKVVAGLIAGWKIPPQSAGAYDVAIPLLNLSFGTDDLTRATRAKALLGADYSAFTTRFGFYVKNSDSNFYAWFTKLDTLLDTLHGAGRINGQIVLYWNRVDAIAAGARFPAP